MISSPRSTRKTLDRRLLTDFDKHKNSDFINALGELLPRKSSSRRSSKKRHRPARKGEHHHEKSSAPAAARAQMRSRSRSRASARSLRPSSPRAAFPCARSAPKPWSPKKCRGLYFAGEVLDVDAYTGGFNLQIAWSTGRLAGLSAAEEESSMKYVSVAIDGPSGRRKIHRGARRGGAAWLRLCRYGRDVPHHRSGGLPQGHFRRGYGRHYRNPAGHPPFS